MVHSVWAASHERGPGDINDASGFYTAWAARVGQFTHPRTARGSVHCYVADWDIPAVQFCVLNDCDAPD
jgi:hypothetical protein